MSGVKVFIFYIGVKNTVNILTPFKWKKTPFHIRKDAFSFNSIGLSSYAVDLPGGAKEGRTPDLLNAIQALSQLSYGPILNINITH